MTDEFFMKQALRLAKKAEALDESPIGCVIVKDGKIIARGWNTRQTKQKAIGHAEIMAIEKACRKLGSWRLEGCTLYVTLEPCPMCAGAIIQSRIERVVFGAYDPKGGCAGSCTDLFQIPQFNHHPVVSGGLMEEESAKLLKDFFRKKRQAAKLNKQMERNA
jgi:tRNA(adenine34) deaminase